MNLQLQPIKLPTFYDKYVNSSVGGEENVYRSFFVVVVALLFTAVFKVSNHQLYIFVVLRNNPD